MSRLSLVDLSERRAAKQAALSPEEWDAAAEVAVGGFIGEYLATHEPPSGTDLAADFRTWGENLRRDGEQRQAQ